MSLVITKPELSEDQQELLSELQSMDFLKTEEEYLWFLNELKDLGIETVNDWDDKYTGTYEGREEIAGAESARNMDLQKQSFLFDQASQRLGAAKAARARATEAIYGGIGQMGDAAGAAGEFLVANSGGGYTV